MEGISDGLQDRGLGRITFANQAEDVGIGEAPVKFFHASKVLDFYFSDLHRARSSRTSPMNWATPDQCFPKHSMERLFALCPIIDTSRHAEYPQKECKRILLVLKSER
jgi:hypothetical protein